MHFCTRCGNPRDAGATLCAWCGTRFNDPDADHPVRVDDATRVDLGEPYQEPQPTIWDYGVPRTPEPSPWAASPTLHDYEAPLLPGLGFGEQAAPSGGYYPEPQPVQADPWAAPPRGESRPGGHRRPSGGRPRGTLVAAGALLVLALGGGAYALTSALTGHPGRASAQGPVTAPTTPAAHTSALPTATPPVATQVRTPRPAAPTTAAPTTAVPVTTAPAQVTPTTEPPDTEPPTASPSPSAGTGTTTVAATAAARASAAEPEVAQFLSNYFTAINRHDYQAYIALLDPAQAARQTPARFAAGYGTTTDSDATLTTIADLGQGQEAASVTFTSRQVPAASPDRSSCDVWHITLYLIPNEGGYLIKRPPSGYEARVRSCS